MAWCLPGTNRKGESLGQDSTEQRYDDDSWEDASAADPDGELVEHLFDLLVFFPILVIQQVFFLK